MNYDILLEEVHQQLEIDFDTPQWAQKCNNATFDGTPRSGAGWYAHYKNIGKVKNSRNRDIGYREFWKRVVQVLRSKNLNNYQIKDMGVPERYLHL